MRRLTVLNTRPREQAAELSALLREAGFEVVEAPAIAIASAWNPTELAAARQALDTYSYVVLASANAGRELLSELLSSDVEIVCGTSTATALGLSNASALPRFSAAAALDWLRPRIRPRQRVLLPRSAQGRDELIDGLIALGADVDAPIAYRSVAAPDAAARLALGGIDVVALCSPSAVRSAAAALQPHMRMVCLGRTTAEAVEALGLRVDAIAESTSMASLVACIEALTGARV